MVCLAAGAARAEVHYGISVSVGAAELQGRAVITRDGVRSKEERWTKALAPAPAGRFLPASSGWYPAPADGVLASYTLSVDVAGGDIAVTPGTLAEEKREGGRYRARFEFPHPSPGIDLMDPQLRQIA